VRHTSRVGIVVVVLLLVGACADDDTASTTFPQTTATTRAATTVPTTSLPEITTSTTRPIPTTTAPPAVEVRPGGSVTVGMRAEPTSLNPLVDGSPTARRIGELHLVGVSDVGPDGRRLPEVVVDLPTVGNGGLVLNEDGTMTVRFEIVSEAVWADGTAISGQDFAFTYETLAGLDGYDPGQGAEADLYSRIIPESIVAGDKSFEFTIDAPTVQHELLFDVLLPRHQVAGTDVTADWNEAPWVSGGPFVLESWERGSAMTFVRNDAYWRWDGDGTQLPYLESLEVRFIPDATRLVDAFRVADVDVIAAPGAVSVIDALAEMTPSGVAVYTLPGPVWEQVSFQFGEKNRNPGSLNADVRFRRAVAHAVDRDAIAADLLGGYGRPMESYVEAYRPEASGSAWSVYGYDPEAARALVAEVCESRGLPCDIDPPIIELTTTAGSDTRARLADALKGMLASAGIGVRIELEAGSLFFGETLTAGTWDVGIWGWEGGPGLAPLVRVHDLWDAEGSPPYGLNYQRWGTAAVEGAEPVVTSSGSVDVNQGPSTVIDEHTERYAVLRDRLQQIVDEQALLSLVADAEALLAEQVVFLPLFARLWVGAVWADRMAGYVPNPLMDTWNVERWHRLDLPEAVAEVSGG